MINIGFIGIGYWGKNLIRNFKKLRDVRIRYLCDINTNVFDSIDTRGIKTVNDYSEILKDGSIDAVIIATNISTHYKLARESLLAGKHVFVEKPLSVKREEVEELTNLAKRKRSVLFVDYTLLYSPSVKKLKEIIELDNIGRIYSIRINRLNLGGIEKDIDVIIDLLPHDISVLYYLLNDFPKEVLSTGSKNLQEEAKDYAAVLCKYDSGVIASINLSRINYEKERTYYICGMKGVVVWDDSKLGNNLKLINNSYSPVDRKTYGKFLPSESSVNVSFPKLDFYDPLSKICEDFVKRCKDKNYVDYELSIKIAEIYTAIKKSEEEKRWIRI